MRLPDFLSKISRKFLLIILGTIIAIGIVFLIWQNNKYKIVHDTIATTIAKKTDSLYTVKYDSLHFDELTGEAYLKNIHIGADTLLIKNTKLDDLPYIILDIRIASLKINGVKTDKALLGRQMIGDSVIIEHPDVTVYFLKPLQKKTKIEAEAKTVYEEILGKLNRIQVGHVFINNISIKGFGFFTKEKGFDLINSNIQLFDVLIDSAHNFDTSRTLFCKQAALQVASFITYNNNRPELRVDQMIFSGKDKSLSFAHIALNRFETENGDSSRLLHATNLTLKGINTNEMVNNKNIIVDTVNCNHITLYQPPFETFKNSDNEKSRQRDSSGFMNVYSIDMKHLGFPEIDFIPAKSSHINLGNIRIKINEVKADKLIKVQTSPIDYSKEIEISCDKVYMVSKDGFYNFSFQNTSLNSLNRQLKIGFVIIKPFLSEKEFAKKAHFQKDRYDIVLNEIALKDIDMKNLLNKKIIASGLIINKTSVKIYTDLQKPGSGKSKVGNYLPQLVKKLNIPINISHASLPNAFIQYTEHEKISDSSGIATFDGSDISVSNLTNLDEAIRKNNVTTVSFDTKVLNAIPLKGEFKFSLNGNGGNFAVNGHVPAFDTLLLNKVSVPMALMRLNSGTISSIDFNFTGNDSSAKGDFVMKYNDLKVDVLKIDKDTKEVKKKGLVSLAANIIVKNNNSNNGNLREENPRFNRNLQKSFFNLVWKTIFTGIKKTVGIP